MEQTIHRIYELEKARLELKSREDALKAELAQAKYDLRQAKAAQLEYGGVQKFLDRLRKKEDRTEALARAVRHGEDHLANTGAELARTSQSLADVNAALAKLPGLDALPDSPEKFRLEGTFCLTVLPGLLEQTLQALEAHREMENEIKTSQIVSHERRQAAAALPVTLATECRQWLTRLENALTGLEIPFSLPAFFQNPEGFLAYATQYTRHDRINEAIAQCVALKKALPSTEKQMES